MAVGRGRLATGQQPAAQPFNAVVTRSDSAGVFCARLGRDRTKPLGPCKGATRRALVTSAGGADGHTHTVAVERLPEGTPVLLLLTDQGPWVLAYDEGVSG